jgi:hypothetical protein
MSISPKLILNIDETGFGASTSGRERAKKVLVQNEFNGGAVYSTKCESRFITCLSTCTISGESLTPGLITKRESDASDAGSASFYTRSVRYSSEKAFVTAYIFKDYLLLVVIPYIERVRANEHYEDSRALIIFDGAKSHLARNFQSLASSNNIVFFVLPPHSSHLLQALDQLYFRRLKSQFQSLPKGENLTKITEMLERIQMATQASSITCFIWK